MATKTKKPVKKMFKVFRSWEMSGWNNVEAKSQQEAEDIIENDDDLPLPDNGDYVDGSCQVNREFTLEYDKKTNEWVNCQN